jgi:hypothetical protein
MRSASCCAPSPSARPSASASNIALRDWRQDRRGPRAGRRPRRSTARPGPAATRQGRRARPRRTPPWRPRGIAPRKPSAARSARRECRACRGSSRSAVVGLLRLRLEQRQRLLAGGLAEPAEEAVRGFSNAACRPLCCLQQHHRIGLGALELLGRCLARGFFAERCLRQCSGVFRPSAPAPVPAAAARPPAPRSR